MGRLLVVLAVLVVLAAGAVLALGPGDDGGDRTVPAGQPAPTVLRDWTFREDPGDRGVTAGWPEGVPGGRPVEVPYVANPGPPAGPQGERAYEGSVGWFERTVEIPRAGMYAVRFASAHHEATVWIDGRRAGRHVGAYEPFEVRERLEPGRHRLVVRVDWRDPGAQGDAGFRRGWFNWGGLNAQVTLSAIGDSELDRPTLHTRVDGDGARVRNRAGARELRVYGTLAGRALRFAPAPVERDGAATVRASLDVPPEALWSPERPVLHQLTLAVGDEATLRRAVGLRELGWEGGELSLNDRPLILRGASLPPGIMQRGDALRPRDMDALIAQLRAIGANATRAQRPLPSELLKRLDTAGIVVWQEVAPWEPAGAWSARTPQARRDATKTVERTVRELGLHPSVMTWSLSNELSAEGHPDGQADWIEQTARHVRELDPTRPVTADLWGRDLPDQALPMHDALDALGITDYIGWYEEIAAAPAEQERVARDRLERMRALFPDKVIAVTELGAESSDENPPETPGGLSFHADLLERRLSTYARVEGLDGVLVWNLRDFMLRPDFRGGSVEDAYPDRIPTPGINAKGLFTRTGEPKPAVEVVRAGLATLAGQE
ncbi:MAG TPA: glycoside hydrolase family 2 TIM barrel-domain containing protein [Solirubrobacteraceae bacterium]|nr:glycoside hydrolase family 2 TIM barrel-domain containing protein [Solirubrobacteraceae bacterium]